MYRRCVGFWFFPSHWTKLPFERPWRAALGRPSRVGLRSPWIFSSENLPRRRRVDFIVLPRPASSGDRVCGPVSVCNRGARGAARRGRAELSGGAR